MISRRDFSLLRRFLRYAFLISIICSFLHLMFPMNWYAADAAAAAVALAVAAQFSIHFLRAVAYEFLDQTHASSILISLNYVHVYRCNFRNATFVWFSSCFLTFSLHFLAMHQTDHQVVL